VLDSASILPLPEYPPGKDKVRRHMQRIWLVIGYSILAVCLLCGSSFAQGAKVLVGVTPLGSASALSPTAGRDRLVKSLNKQKNSQAEAVALDASADDEVSAGAKQKNCEFVLVTTQTGVETSSDFSAGRTMSGNIPKYKVTVEYKLYRVSDPTPVASGSGKAEDMAEPKDVVGQALDSVAKKVTADIKKAAVAPPTK